MPFRLISTVLAFCAAALPLAAQQPDASWPHPVPRLDLAASSITLRQHAETEKPFTVAGECGALLGQQNGVFESWIFPVKLFSDMRMEARVEGYDVPIDLNRDAAEIEVSPDHTTLTYSHIAFTLRETFFATPCATQDGTGVMALLELDSIRPLTLTLSFTPEMKPMWPAPLSGDVDPEWVPAEAPAAQALNDTTRPGGSGARYPAGWYMLHTDRADLAGALALPGSQPGILAPYQEKPHTYPLQFVLHFDPAHDRGRAYPLLMATGASKQQLAAKLHTLNDQVASLYAANQAYYAHFFDHRTTAETPDPAFDRDLRWAALAIDQLRVRHGAETGLVAGFFSSGSSARPGFGWFFGRDTLFTTWGINSYGDYTLTRDALSFLIARQRADGKIPHEFSQTAEQVDWTHLPYEYAAADATPLFLMAVDDFLRSSGDLAFLNANWPAIQKAWQFETTHDADGDGIYDNAQGTGWVESWPQGMPHQEIYLAALDQQASAAMAHLATAAGHPDLAPAATQRAQAISAKILTEYKQPDGLYAFSHNPDGSADKTATLYPSIAWWDGRFSLPNADRMFTRWSSHEFSTDWGTRDLSQNDPVYDPISYHQGSVWPLFTGWLALADYRTGRSLDGYAHLLQNANLTDQQDLGAVTELLSGQYFVPFGRSTSHQLWSSAMVLIPALRGLFGVDIDALTHTVTVDPHLPAQWPAATLHHLMVGADSATLHYQREGTILLVTLTPENPGAALKLASHTTGATLSPDAHQLRLPLPAVEVGLDLTAGTTLPLPGASTAGLKVLSQQADPHQLTLTLEAEAGSRQTLLLRLNDPHAHLTVKGADRQDDRLHIAFPGGDGYRQQTVTLRW